MGLAISLFVGAIATSGAQGDYALPAGDDVAGAYFPWVPHGSDLDGMGPFYGAVTVQNVNGVAADLYFYPGEGASDAAYGDPYVVANVQPNASVTVSSGAMDLDEPGGSVRVHAVPEGTPYDDDEDAFGEGDDDNGGFEAAEFLAITGTVKNVSPMPSNNAQTDSQHITIDGYSGLNSEHFGDADNGSYKYVLPIIQTNDGWNTELRLANFGPENDPNASSSYTVTIYESGGQGAAGPSAGAFTGSLRSGEVVHHDLLNGEGFEEGFVGNAFITSNQPMGAVAERYKVENDMLLTNTARTETDQGDTQVAPLIFRNYNNWNSGISVANLSESDSTTVTITYITEGGSQVSADQVTIPRRGMEFVFTPGTQELGVDEFVGAAVITSSNDAPIQVAVDQVKYFGESEDAGDAMSYTTDDQFAGGVNSDDRSGQQLTLPLVQKGNPNTGYGDTSGVQFFNADPMNNVVFAIEFYDPTGNLVAPTLDQPIVSNLSGHQGLTIYTHDYSELPTGFQGSLVVNVAPGSGGLLSAVSNNVNYEVQGDGGAVFNLINTGEFGTWPQNVPNNWDD